VGPQWRKGNNMLEESLGSCKAVIFDFDGTLFHTEDTIEKCWEQVAQEEKKPFSHNLFLQGGGLRDASFIRDVIRWADDETEIARIKKRKEDLYLHALEHTAIEAAAGIQKLLSTLRDRGILLAIGSSSIRKNIDMILSHHEEMRKVFSVIISADDVTKGKPDPEVYLLAASRLGVDPSNCVVFEDAPLGIEAGKRAGMKVIGIASTRSSAELSKAHPDQIIPSFLVLCR
jgi:beta-phosphoglucomutase family hydrolase